MKTNLAILGAKGVRKASQMIGFGGGDMPGRIARKIDKGVLQKLAEQVENIIVITGTNGKTTTSNLLANILKESGEEIIHNAEGNNLITGITTAFITKSGINNKLDKEYKYAVLEVDEGNVPLVVKETKPKYVIVNNFFRDQLNRFGEIDTIVEKIKMAIRKSKASLILNADDPFVMRIGLLEREKVFFGLKQGSYSFDQYTTNESKFCPQCGEELEYDYIHYGQLGFFKCSCGFKRAECKYEVSAIREDMSFDLGEEIYKLGIGGTYNVYNALGAIACAKEFGIKEEAIKKALSSYEANNGRMQEYKVGNSTYLLNLAKNQVSSDISISDVMKSDGEKQIVFILNDLDHDSADVSWIWDADYERLTETGISRIICSGTRAYDMAVRVKYAGIPEEKIVVVENIEESIEKAFEIESKTYILPTYTALSPSKKYLDKKIKEA